MPHFCVGLWEALDWRSFLVWIGRGLRPLGWGEAELSSRVARVTEGLGTKWGVNFHPPFQAVQTREVSVWMSQWLRRWHAISLDGDFVSDLYREGLASGWGLSLCKVWLSLTLSWLGSWCGQCTCPAIPPSPDSCPVHMDGSTSLSNLSLMPPDHKRVFPPLNF